jgi:Tol biopolymer transport system component
MRKSGAMPFMTISMLCLACAILAAVAGCSSGSGGGAASCSVIYAANGATAGSVPSDAAAYRSGQTVTLLGNSGRLVRTGFAFVGWNTAPDGSGVRYRPGDRLAMGSGDLALYAEWEEALVSFLRSEEDEYPVYVMRQDGTGTPTLVSPETGDFDYPTISPLQDKVLFTEYASGKIYVVGIGNAGAALPEPLVDLGSAPVHYPSFSKDGTKIAFSVDAAEAESSGIYVADASTGAYGKIANTPDNADHPSWSPDGSTIVYEYSDGNLYTISAVDPDDVPHLLAQGGYPAWSPTDGKIAFTGDGWVYVIAYGETEPSELTQAAADSSDYVDYWSADGALVVFDRFGPDGSDLCSVRAADKAFVDITNTAEEDEFCNNG